MAIIKTANKGVSRLEEQLKKLRMQEAELKAQLRAEQEAATVAAGELVRAHLDKLPADLREQVAFPDVAEQIATLDAKIAKLARKRGTLAAGVNKKAGEVVLANVDKLSEGLRKKIEVLVGIEGEPEIVEEQLELGTVQEQAVTAEVEPNEHQGEYKEVV